MPAAVHQLLPVISRGDAISGAAVRFRDLLRANGYRSELFAKLIDRHLGVDALPAERLPAELGEGDAVVYHLSIGSTLAADFAQLRARRIVYYHNITPVKWAEDWSPVIAHHLRWGRGDLERLAPFTELAVAPSDYSARELHEAGYGRVAMVPLPLLVQRLHPRTSRPSSPVTMLFVGRLAPHKRQDELIRVLAALRATRCPDARLQLVGGAAIPEYVRALHELATRLGVEDAVEIHTGQVSDHTIGDLYARASVFVCASEHEGFCVPLLEAMAFSVPVIAHRSAAVAETAGAGGMLVTERDPLVWAELVWRVATAPTLRESLTAAGRARVAEFSDPRVATALDSALATIGIHPPH